MVAYCATTDTHTYFFIEIHILNPKVTWGRHTYIIGGGGLFRPPQDLSPYCTYEHEILHAFSIWPIFLEYNIKVKFYCLKTA